MDRHRPITQDQPLLMLSVSLLPCVYVVVSLVEPGTKSRENPAPAKFAGSDATGAGGTVELPVVKKFCQSGCGLAALSRTLPSSSKRPSRLRAPAWVTRRACRLRERLRRRVASGASLLWPCLPVVEPDYEASAAPPSPARPPSRPRRDGGRGRRYLAARHRVARAVNSERAGQSCCDAVGQVGDGDVGE
jgi:hypothetical protein